MSIVYKSKLSNGAANGLVIKGFCVPATYHKKQETDDL